MILIRSRTFVARVPKCGSIWLEAVLQRNGLKTREAYRKLRFREGASHGFCSRHIPFWALSEEVDNILAIVRHPAAWLESWWRYQCAMGWPRLDAGTVMHSRPSHPQWPLYGLGDDDFNVFVRNVLEREPGYVTRLYEWFLGPEMPVHDLRIARLEHAQTEVPAAFASLGYHDLVLPGKTHVSPPRDLVWDSGLWRDVLAAEAPAIRRFYPETL